MFAAAGTGPPRLQKPHDPVTEMDWVSVRERGSGGTGIDQRTGRAVVGAAAKTNSGPSVRFPVCSGRRRVGDVPWYRALAGDIEDRILEPVEVPRAQKGLPGDMNSSRNDGKSAEFLGLAQNIDLDARRADGAVDDLNGHDAKELLDAVAQPEFETSANQFSENLPSLVGGKAAVDAETGRFPDLVVGRQLPAVHEIRPELLDHVWQGGRNEAGDRPRLAQLIAPHQIYGGRRVELIPLHVAIRGNVILLSLHEHPVAKAVHGGESVTKMVSGFKRNCVDHVPLPLLGTLDT